MRPVYLRAGVIVREAPTTPTFGRGLTVELGQDGDELVRARLHADDVRDLRDALDDWLRSVGR